MKTFDEYAQAVKSDLLDGGRNICISIFCAGMASAVISAIAAKNVKAARNGTIISAIVTMIGFTVISLVSNGLIEAEEESQYHEVQLSDFLRKENNTRNEKSMSSEKNDIEE